jgi:hypothetical protein
MCECYSLLFKFQYCPAASIIVLVDFKKNYSFSRDNKIPKYVVFLYYHHRFAFSLLRLYECPDISSQMLQ